MIFISSTAAVETFMGPTSYNAIKAGLITHANGLSRPSRRKGIRVNTVSPGPIMVEGGSWDMIKTHNEAMYNATVSQIPVGRLGHGSGGRRRDCVPGKSALGHSRQASTS